MIFLINNYKVTIEFILLGVIAIVLIVDFILRGIKKKDTTEKGLEKFEGAFEESIKQSKFNYILSRKRNIVSFIILAHILKISIHYFFYRAKNTATYGLTFNKVTGLWCQYSSGRWGINTCRQLNEFMDFIWHIENIYFSEVWLLITSFIILVVLVWLFNDKIKAR